MGIFTRRKASTEPTPASTTITGVSSPWADNSHLADVVYADLFGSDLDGLVVNRDLAMKVPAFARGRNILCTTAGRLPLVAYRNAERMTERTCIDQPEPGRPRFITILWTVDQMMWHGRAWWVVTERYAEDGRPKSFEWVPEWSAVLDVRGQLTGTNDGRHFKPEDVIRLDAPHEGILRFAADTIRQAIRLDRSVLRIAENPVPAIELHQTTADPMTAEEKDGLIAGWIKARRKTGVGYTNAAIETKVHGLNPEQLLIEGRKYVALEAARHLNVPAWAVDAPVEGSSITYSNVASRSRELVDFGLTPYLAAIEGRLSMDDVLPRGQWCRFDLDDLLRGDFGDRMTAYKTAIESGVYTKEDLRAREDGVPVESESTE